MKYLSIIIIYLVGFHQLNAQDLETRLSSSDRVDCSVYAENSSALIGTYNIHQIDSATAVLDIWERECGKSEPVLRLRMLHDIFYGRFDSEDYLDYYQQYIRKYIYRTDASKRTTAKSDYENSKAYYDYTMLGDGYDNLTATLAQSLLGQQGENSDAYLMCILFSNDVNRFNELAYSSSRIETPLTKNMYDSQNASFINFRISGGLGIWLPLGNNQDVFRSSPMISIGMHHPICRIWRLDGSVIIVPFVDIEPLDFYFEGKNETSRSLVSVHFSLGATRMHQLSKKIFLDTGFSIGFNSLDTDIDDPNEEDFDQSLGTMDLGAKVALRYKMKNGRSIALQSGVHYASYNWSSHLKSEVGNKYATVGLAVGF